MASSWAEEFDAAKAALAEQKFFDGVQLINSCMGKCINELSGQETLGDEAIKEPMKFLEDFSGSLEDEQRQTLREMFEVRGDIIAGLGANKRAETDYACAQLLTPDGEDEALKQKQVAVAERARAKSGVLGKVPVTVITGFLGSGKTTLLNRILSENHGKRIAVIENEFGEVGIDDGLLQMGALATTEENIIEMNNGCICCTVRGDLIAGLKKMVKNAQKSGKPLDAVMVETTGLADPAPVAQTFFADEFVQAKLCLDGILTLVDAKHIIEHLDEEKPEGVENEAVEQIAFADRILLNKCDLVEEEELAEVKRRIRMINDAVQIQQCTNSEVDMDFILGIQAFDLDKILEMDDAFLADNAEHQHDERVSSVGFHVPGQVDQAKLNEWISWLLQEKGADIFRTKGILAVEGMDQKFVFQAVHMAFSGAPQRPWAEDEERVCKLTFIGKNLDREELEAGFGRCLVK